MHPTEQRLDQAVENLRAKPGNDQVGDRRVVRDGTSARQNQIKGRAGEACGRHQTRSQQRQQPVGDPEQRARREPAQPAARPHMRPQRRRSDDLVAESEVLEQSSHGRYAHQQSIRPGVDLVPAELLSGNLAAQLGSTLDHSELHARTETTMYRVRRRQPADPAADDHDPRSRLHRAPPPTQGLTSSTGQVLLSNLVGPRGFGPVQPTREPDLTSWCRTCW